MYKTSHLLVGMPYFEVLGCCVTKSEQLLVVTDSGSASRNLHDDDQGHRLLSVCGSDDLFPLANDPYIFQVNPIQAKQSISIKTTSEAA